MSYTVIKIGGKLIEDAATLDRFCDRMTKMPLPLVVVHGGGKMAGELCRRLHIPEQIIGGRRVTDEQTLEVAVMTYAGWVNKKLVSALQKRGINACGLSGCDMRVVTARKRITAAVDWGYVGDIESVNTAVLKMMFREGIVPVLSPITFGIDGVVLNTNADSVAAAVAEALSKDGVTDLIYCFDKKGVLADVADELSVIPRMNRKDYESCKKNGIFQAGMLPKLENAFESVSNGVRTVRLVHPDDLDDPLAGTLISEN